MRKDFHYEEQGEHWEIIFHDHVWPDAVNIRYFGLANNCYQFDIFPIRKGKIIWDAPSSLKVYKTPKLQSFADRLVLTRPFW
jgi:hypothetical protein